MLKRFLWICLIFWCVVIYFFSAQPGYESNKISKKIVNQVSEEIDNINTNTNNLDFNKDSKSYKPINKKKFNKFVRKFAHFFLYLILGIITSLLAVQYKIPWYYVCIFCFLYGFTDEIHQLIVPGRSGGYKDVIIDFLGSIAGQGITYGYKNIKR
ncbi:MAG: VanZ family protein [Clostridia bacterium]|nr:VanZ family protein [Clostridia bacterium]